MVWLEESRMSSQNGDIDSPGRPQMSEVSAGIYAYILPDGSN